MTKSVFRKTKQNQQLYSLAWVRNLSDGESVYMLISEISLEINCLSLSKGLALTPWISPVGFTTWPHKCLCRHKEGESAVAEARCQESRNASCSLKLPPA